MHNITRHKPSSSYNHVIDNLQDYILSTRLYTKFDITNKTRSSNSNTSNNKKHTGGNSNNKRHIGGNDNNKHVGGNAKKEDKEMTIKEQDQLFWYFYIAKYGRDEYKYLDHKFIKEKDLKIKNIETMKQNTTILKQNKIKISEYETDLLNSKKISISTLQGLCAYNEVNIIYIKKKTYYFFNFNDSDNPIIIKNNGKTHSCITNPTSDEINNIKHNYYRIDNPSKPIKAASNYKLDEIIDICNKLDISVQLPSGKKKNKGVLYQEIKAYL